MFSHNKSIILPILLLIIPTQITFAQTKTWDGGAGTSNWSDANNWSPNGLPSSSDYVIIDAGTVVIPNTFTANARGMRNRGLLTIVAGGTLAILDQSSLSNQLTGSIENFGSITITHAGNVNSAIVHTGTGTFTNHGSIEVSTGYNFHTMQVTAPFINMPAGEITLNSGGQTGILLRALFTNHGVLNIDVPATVNAIRPLATGGVFVNEATGEINITNCGQGVFNQTSFTNRGVVSINSSGSGITNLGTFVNENGTINLTTTSLFPVRNNAGATMSGTGQINMPMDGDLWNAGQIEPGLSPGILNVAGGLQFSGTGATYQFELASSSSFDVINITEDLLLSGILEVQLLNGFIPNTNEQFPIITYGGTVNGTFATINLPSPEFDEWLIDYGTITPGEITLYHPNSLPIQLVSFEAKKQGTQVELNWRTASELNNEQFIVQHSTDGNDFKDISVIRGAGNSLTEINYQFIHQGAVNGQNYYRLKQIDFGRYL